MTNVMEGKRGLVMGVANDRSIAWGIAKALHGAGAELAFTYQGESFGARLKPLAESVGSDFTVDVDVTDDASLDAAFAALQARWPTIDFLVHAIAYSDKSELTGRFLNTSRANFKHSLDVSCYSFIEVARLAHRLAPLRRAVRRAVREEGIPEERIEVRPELAMRYRGQSYELPVAFDEDVVERFHRAHRDRYGHAEPGDPVEAVTIRVRGVGDVDPPPLPAGEPGPPDPSAALLDRRPATTLAPWAAGADVALLCYGTLAGGFLTDRWLGQPDPGFRFDNRSLVKYRLIIDEFGPWELFQELLAALKAVGDRHGSSGCSRATPSQHRRGLCSTHRRVRSRPRYAARRCRMAGRDARPGSTGRFCPSAAGNRSSHSPCPPVPVGAPGGEESPSRRAGRGAHRRGRCPSTSRSGGRRRPWQHERRRLRRGLEWGDAGEG